MHKISNQTIKKYERNNKNIKFLCGWDIIFKQIYNYELLFNFAYYIWISI